MKDVTVHVPTAHGRLAAAAPVPGEVTADDIIKFQAGQLQASATRIQELEVALGTITNIAACALKVLDDLGYSEGEGEISFSHDLTDRMYGANLTLSEDFGGGIRVRWRHRTTAPVLLER